VGAVLVAGHHHARHLVVQRVLALLVALLVGAVEALDDQLAHARAVSEPDRHPDQQDVGAVVPILATATKKATRREAGP
jgi:hypothetical protein